MSLFSLVDVRPLFLCEFKKFSLIWGYPSKTNMFCFLFFAKVDVFCFLSFPYPALNFIWQNGYYLGRQMSREVLLGIMYGPSYGSVIYPTRLSCLAGVLARISYLYEQTLSNAMYWWMINVKFANVILKQHCILYGDVELHKTYGLDVQFGCRNSVSLAM